VIIGQHLRAARGSLGWRPRTLASKAKVPLSVVERAESSPGEPAVTITQLNALMRALRAAGASFPPADPNTDGEERP
jgi:ribosome-binding protein aMBF1 (putative translation factor)